MSPWFRLIHLMVIPGGRRRASTIIGNDFPKPVGRAPNRWWPPDDVSSAAATMSACIETCDEVIFIGLPPAVSKPGSLSTPPAEQDAAPGAQHTFPKQQLSSSKCHP